MMMVLVTAVKRVRMGRRKPRMGVARLTPPCWLDKETR